jgi:hypothetical protein
VPGIVLVLMIVGLIAPVPVALPALLIVLAFVTWLAFLSWSVIDSRGKLVRVFMVVLVLASLAGRISGWL